MICLAAYADNDANNTSSATLNGTWNIANDLTLSANQHDDAYISGYSARGAIFTDGIVNIAYKPEYSYADEAKKLRDELG